MSADHGMLTSDVPTPDVDITATREGHTGPPIDVGWVLVGAIDANTRAAVDRATRHFAAYARESWPEFAWSTRVVARRNGAWEYPAEPVTLLDLGMAELDAARWDFAFVVTEAELRSYEKPFALGVTARSYGVAVLSTARLTSADSVANGPPAAPDLSNRLFALAVHEFGHLNDIAHEEDPRDFMFDLSDVGDLDRMRELAPDASDRLRAQLVDVADLRLEERARIRSAAQFYLRATWTNRRQILHSVVRMRPWAFPLRLNRLTAAALSTMVIFLITAEAWELGMRQRPPLVLALSAFALAATSIYVLKRQRLIAHLRGRRFSEQRVLGNVSMTAAVFLGMASTYSLVFATTLLATQLVFDAAIVRAWTGLDDDAIQLGHFTTLSGFIAAVGILIGALGASFEAEGYFRHVALVDEET